jgi:pyridoxine 5-phosphate synthase
MKARLGVNIDHVATLRQQRGTDYPSIEKAARVVLENGADQITMHLREDRRHVQDADMFLVKKITDEFNKPLNFEMGCAKEIIDIAIEIAPAWICLVPENREEKTTEGGLDLLDDKNFQRIKETCQIFREKSPKSKISLFVEADEDILNKCIKLNVDAVEIHTGEYAIDFLKGMSYSKHLKKYEHGKAIIGKAGIGFHAGHGLTYESTVPLVELNLFKEYNIGHNIICQAIFEGLSSVIKNFHSLLNRN